MKERNRISLVFGAWIILVMVACASLCEERLNTSLFLIDDDILFGCSSGVSLNWCCHHHFYGF